MNAMTDIVDVTKNDPHLTEFEMVDGGMFDPMSPDPALIEIGNIAVALSNACRFGGHVRRFYSTAQHSVLVAYLAPNDIEAQKMAILHDADEAFGLPDMLTQVKRRFPSFCKAQARIGKAIEKRFELSHEAHARIKPADRQALLREKADLKDSPNDGYWASWSGGMTAPEGIEIIPLQPDAAHDLFMAAYERVFLEHQPIDAEWLAGQPGFRFMGPENAPSP